MFLGSRLRRLLVAGAVIVSGIAMTTGLAAISVGATGYSALVQQTLPAAVASAQRLGSEQPNTTLDIVVGLNPRSEVQLEAAVEAMYTPGSAAYKHYLTPAQFTARFGPTVTQYHAVLSYLRGTGFHITYTAPNRLLVGATGTVAQVDRAFHVTIGDYREAGTGIPFYANDQVPSVPSSLVAIISGIVGLTNLDERHPLFRSAQPVKHVPVAPYTPQEMEQAYNVTPLVQLGLGGTGVTTSVLAEGDFAKYGPADLKTFESTYHLPPVPVTIIGSSNDNSGNAAEPYIDSDWVSAMAPTLTSMRFYIAKNLQGSSFVTMENTWVNDPNAGPVASESYAQCETQDSTLQMESRIFTQGALEGRSVFIGTGDSDAPECFSHGRPVAGDSADASFPSVTSVGGTTLTLESNGSYGGESVWNTVCGGSFPCGTGGAPSLVFKEPFYQKGISIIDQTGMRAVSDIAADADPNSGIDAVIHGQFVQFGGTSVATVLVNGMFSDVDSFLMANNKAPLGFANPVLYKIGESQAAKAAYHDVVVGNNFFPLTPFGYNAGVGWDFPTGWGSPNVYGLSKVLLKQ